MSYSVPLLNISRLTMHNVGWKSLSFTNSVLGCHGLTKPGGLTHKSPSPRNQRNCFSHAGVADSKRKNCQKCRFKDVADSGRTSQRRRRGVDQNESSFIQKSVLESINNFLEKVIPKMLS